MYLNSRIKWYFAQTSGSACLWNIPFSFESDKNQILCIDNPAPQFAIGEGGSVLVPNWCALATPAPRISLYHRMTVSRLGARQHFHLNTLDWREKGEGDVVYTLHFFFKIINHN